MEARKEFIKLKGASLDTHVWVRPYQIVMIESGNTGTFIMTQQGQVQSIDESGESILAKIAEFNAWNNQFTKHMGFIPDEMFKTEPASK